MNHPSLEKMRMAHIQLCPVCRRWVVLRDDHTKPVAPLLPESVHSLPELVGG